MKVDGIEIPDLVGLQVLAGMEEAPRVTLEIFATEVTFDGEASLEVVTQVLDASGMKAVPLEDT